METVVNVLLNPITLAVIGLVIILGIMMSPYEIKLDEQEDELDF